MNCGSAMQPAGSSQKSFISDSFEFTCADEREYAENGFVCWQRFLSAEGLRRLQHECSQVLAECDARVDREWILNLHQLLPPDNNWVWALANEPKLVAAVQRCLKSSEVVLYCSQLAVRHAGSKSYTPWHQDGQGGAVCTVWICLDRVSPKNGGLRVLVGEHRGRREYKQVTCAKELEVALKYAEHNVFECECEEQNVHSYRLRAGGAGIHHAFLPHSTLPNVSSTDRRVIILRYMLANEARLGGFIPDYRNVNTKVKRTYPRVGSPLKAAKAPQGKS